MPNATVRASAQAMPIDRRVALGSLAAAAGAMLAPPRFAKAAEASPVSRAYAAFLTAYADWERAWDSQEKAFERYEDPELPDWHPLEGGSHLTVTLPDGKRRVKLCCSDESVADLREGLAKQIAFHDEHGFEFRPVVEQISKALAKVEAYRAECQRRRDALGLDALMAARQEADARLTRAAEATLALEPESITDLGMQADVVLRSHIEDEDSVLKRLVSIAGLPLSLAAEA